MEIMRERERETETERRTRLEQGRMRAGDRDPFPQVLSFTQD
jgi:hypothetical protein